MENEQVSYAELTQKLEAAQQRIAELETTVGAGAQAIDQASVSYYRQMFEASESIKLVIDPTDGRIVEANGAAEQFYGYEALTSMCITDINTLSVKEVKEKMLLAQQQARTFSSFRHRLATGEIRDVEVYSGSVQAGDRELLYSTIHDVTERVRSQDALQVSEAQFRSLAESTRDYIMRYDREGRHLYMNPAALKVSGFVDADIIGKTHREAGFEGEVSALWETSIESVFETGQPTQATFEWEGVDGTVFLDWRLYPELDAVGEFQTVLGISRDITESKLAEQELRATEERFRTLFDDVPVPLWEEDFSDILAYLEELKFREIDDFEDYLVQHPEVVLACLARVKILAVNKAALGLHEADTLEDIISGLERTLTDGSFRAFRGELIAIWRGDHTYETETELSTLSGATRAVALSWSVSPGHEETLSRIFVATKDVTRRRRAELFESDQRRVLELISGGQASQDDILVAITQIAEKHAADVRSSILLLDGQSIRHGAAPSMPSAYNSLLDGLPIGPSVGSCGTAMYRKERVIVEDVSTDPLWAAYCDLGSKYGFRSCWSQPVLDSTGAVLGSFALYCARPCGPNEVEIDLIEAMANLAGITIQRAKREAELKKLSAAVEQSPASVLIADQAGSIEYVNASFCNLTGYTFEEVKGKTPQILRGGKTPAETHTKIWDTALSGREWKGELHNKKKSGESYWVSGSIFPVLDNAGKVSHILAVCEDVTAHKALEAENVELERHLRRSQKLETIGTLAGGIAHDFNNILTPILGYAEIAASKNHSADALQTDFEQIINAAQRAKSLVERILLFSRQTEKERRPVQVSLIAHEAIQLLRPSIPSTISIVQDIDGVSSWALADETQIHEVFVNLCTNAYHAMDGQSGTLTVGVDQVELDTLLARQLPSLQAPKYVRIRIRDTGTGMDSATIDRIFEPFYTTKPVGKGSGMGLAVVHGIVKSHDGDVLIHSELGEGTVFEVYLPAATAEAQNVDPNPQGIDKGHESIMVVDDDPAVAEVVALMVKRLGYKVEVYTNSLQALKSLQEHEGRFDLVVSDLTMPGLTGIDLARQAGQCKPPVSVLIMTGHGERLEQEGCDSVRVIAKPVAMKLLARAIRSVLHQESDS